MNIGSSGVAEQRKGHSSRWCGGFINNNKNFQFLIYVPIRCRPCEGAIEFRPEMRGISQVCVGGTENLMHGSRMTIEFCS
jgi:hypothetical protein